MVRKRQTQTGASEARTAPPKLQPTSSSDEKMPDHQDFPVGGSGRNARQTQWIFFAVASGACAAFNGVFAKLTTTGLTTKLANGVADFLGLSSIEHVVEYIVRGIFFALNLTFNGVMWTLFTTALARGTSTTQVSILNTSTNFVLTALLGLAIFSESLPPLWWAGASLLVAGSVIVGRKDESKDSPGAEGGYGPVPQEEGEDDLGRRKSEDDDDDGEDEDVIDLGNIQEGRA